MTPPESAEYPLLFECEGAPLVGIVHPGRPDANIGVVVVVGGPQYRAGSHRQFTELGRAVAAAGFPVLRFDLRGMGDSGGVFPGFEAIDADIRAAVDALTGEFPELDGVALWGLCDGASAISFYAHRDPRISGVALLKPWVRTEATYAQAQIRHYYAARLFSRSFWARLGSGKIDFRDSIRSLSSSLQQAWQTGSNTQEMNRDDENAPFPDRMRRGLAAFSGRILITISGNDLTAREFLDVTAADPGWRIVMDDPKTERFDLPDADHTLSRADWSLAVSDRTADWCASLAERRSI